jgi:hypothetical protein
MWASLSLLKVVELYTVFWGEDEREGGGDARRLWWLKEEKG